MRKKLKIVQVLNKFSLFFGIFSFICGCCYKAPPISKKPIEKVYQGTIWWEITYLTNNQTKTFSGYADFQTGKNFLYLRLKSPINTTLGYGKWEISSFNIIEIFDLYNKKYYLVVFNQHPELKNIPLYFLGLKKEKNWNFLKTSFKYSFINNEKKGFISSHSFSLKWRFKSISSLENFKPLLKDSSFLKDFKKIKIIF